MFTNISWTTYLTFVAVLLATWYLTVGLRFYLSDLQMLLSGKRKTASGISNNEFQPIQPDEAINSGPEASGTLNKEQTEQLFNKAESLAVKIKDAVSAASEKNYQKEEFSFLLQLTLKEYPELKGTSFQVAINNLIVSECEKHGFIRPNGAEIEMLWSAI